MKTGWGAGEHTYFMCSVHILFPCSNEIILVMTHPENEHGGDLSSSSAFRI